MGGLTKLYNPLWVLIPFSRISFPRKEEDCLNRMNFIEGYINRNRYVHNDNVGIK